MVVDSKDWKVANKHRKVAIKDWKIPGFILGFIGGFLVFQFLFVNQPIINLFGIDEEASANWKQGLKRSKNSLRKTEDSNWISTPNANNIIPSLNEDWGKLDCPLTNLSQDKQNLFDYFTDITLSCEMQVMVGGKFHKGQKKEKDFFAGEKYICLDKSFDFNHDNCTSLSFGISTDWSFDDELDKVYGCKVYAFDPTIGLQDHNRSENIKFYNLGISDRPGLLGGGKLESYSRILKKLNLENTTIDYLKMDVEESEWKFLENVLMKTPNLLKNVRQMGMEIHLGASAYNYEKVWNYFQRLHCFGFRIMFSHYNPHEEKRIFRGKRIANLYEIVWGQDRKW